MSIEYKKKFIREKLHLLDRATKIKILSITINEAGKGAIISSDSEDVVIDLDYAQRVNESTIHLFYNLVESWVDSLNKPVQ